MKHLLLTAALLTAATGIALLTNPSFAGGPVLITTEEPPGKIAEARGEGGWVLPVIVGAIVLCAIACGGGDDSPIAPGPVCHGDDGGDGC